jgi:membrane protein DedA with SNARE-associated domain
MEPSAAELTKNGPWVLFAWVLAEQLGVPIPAMPALLAAGALARAEGVDPLFPLALALTASLIADGIWYTIGRRGGTKVISFLCRVSLEPDSCVRRTEDLFARNGARSLILAKWVPGLSTAAPPLAGVVRMRPSRFLLYSATGGVLWAGTSILFGYLFSRQLEEIAAMAEGVGGWLKIAVVLLAVYIFVKWWSRRRFLRSIQIGRIGPEELKRKLDDGESLVVVDLRSSIEFEAEPDSIPGAMRIDEDDLVREHKRIPRDRDVILFCT